MLQQLFSFLLILALCAGLWACSNREDEAQARFDQVYEVERVSGPGQAESLYWQLIADYPEAPASQQARGSAPTFSMSTLVDLFIVMVG